MECQYNKVLREWQNVFVVMGGHNIGFFSFSIHFTLTLTQEL